MVFPVNAFHALRMRILALHAVVGIENLGFVHGAQEVHAEVAVEIVIRQWCRRGAPRRAWWQASSGRLGSFTNTGLGSPGLLRRRPGTWWRYPSRSAVRCRMAAAAVNPEIPREPGLIIVDDQRVRRCSGWASPRCTSTGHCTAAPPGPEVVPKRRRAVPRRRGRGRGVSSWRDEEEDDEDEKTRTTRRTRTSELVAPTAEPL